MINILDIFFQCQIKKFHVSTFFLKVSVSGLGMPETFGILRKFGMLEKALQESERLLFPKYF